MFTQKDYSSLPYLIAIVSMKKSVRMQLDIYMVWIVLIVTKSSRESTSLIPTGSESQVSMLPWYTLFILREEIRLADSRLNHREECPLLRRHLIGHNHLLIDPPLRGNTWLRHHPIGIIKLKLSRGHELT